MALRELALTPVIRTKLYRPRVPPDAVSREGLHRILEAGRDRPLTLVSAPAGYGKSTLVAQWLQSSDRPSAWLALDAADSELRVFLEYVVAAIRTVSPEACGTLLLELQADTLSAPSALAGSLCNDLEALDHPFVLVLDDYHQISEADVHDVLDTLLAHPPRALHLVIISRRDPALSLGALRAHDWLTEVRMGNLQFSEWETLVFLQHATGHTIGDAALRRLHESTEGWPVALRLAASALQHRSDVDAFVQEFAGDTQDVQEYLVGEVLSQQPAAIVEWLCQTSLLGRFCASLCDAVCTMSGEGEEALSGSAFITWLKDAGLLCLSLDERREWYRYHHLFQGLLFRRLEAWLAPDEIADLHRRAATWFEAHGLLEEAIDHVLQGSGPVEAGHLIARHRTEILNGEQWHRLGRWLRRLPAETIEADPELMMLKAWHLQLQGWHSEALSIRERLEEGIGSTSEGSAANAHLRGGIDAMRSYQYYEKGEIELARKYAEQALMRLPAHCMSERAYALMVKGGALRASGDLQGARKVLYDALADFTLPMGALQARMLMGLCLINWVAADLSSVRLTAKQYLELGEELGLPESALNGRYFLGIAQYHQDELSQAESSLAPLISTHSVPSLPFLTESVFALASVYEATGRAEKARESVETVCEYLLRIRNTSVLERAQAYQANLALRQGRMAEALRWAQGFDPEPFQAMYRFHEPRMTLARVLITEGSAPSLARATDLLTRLEDFLARVHGTRFLIEVLALQALLRDAQGNEWSACDALGRAVALAQPGGFIRLFVDLGLGLVPLLNRLDLDGEGRGYVGRVLAAFEVNVRERPESMGVAARSDSSADALTGRELEILGMLSRRWSNKEIAKQLRISPATVKRHTENLYAKLEVHGRQEAVAKAQRLAILGRS